MSKHYPDIDTMEAPVFEPEELPAAPRRPRRRVMAENAAAPPIVSLPPEPESLRRTAEMPATEPQQPSRAKAVASPTKAAKKEAEPKKPGLLSRLKADKRPGMFMGVVCLIAATYILISFISYIVSAGAADQSIIHSSGLDGAVASTATVKNAGGPLGAWLSECMISGSMGLGAFAVPAYLALLGMSLVGLRRLSFWRLTVKSLVVMIATSVVVGMVTYQMPTSIYWGGLHGHEVNNFLLEVTGVWGMIGVSVILVAAVALIFLKQITDAMAAANRFVTERREAMRQRCEAAATAERDEESGETEKPEKAEDTARSEGLSDISGMTEHGPQIDGETHEADQQEVTITIADDPLANLDDSDYQSEGEVVIQGGAEHITGEPEVTVAKAAPIEEAVETTDETDHYDPTAELSHFRRPTVDLLIDRPIPEGALNDEEQKANIDNIRKMLGTFGISIARIEATVGPTVTLYEIVPAEGVRINRIRSLEDDLALSLSAIGIRIIAPMPGKGTIGIEVPNKKPRVVSIRSILASRKYQESTAELPMAMGATISNDVYIADLTRMPHLLVAGSTGMGKSVGLNTIIASILYKKHPAEVKFVLIDPKMVEFSLYNKIERHYLAALPGEDEAIITNMDKVVPVLNSLCLEMDQRYELLKAANVRAVKEYNEKFVNLKLNPAKGHRYMPYIVVVIDEFADLIMTAGKEVETPIARIAQKARAVGIHVILATQRPSANIITGVIRANFPGRIAFRVTQQLESRIILDRPGANQLIGRGDMLFSRDGVIERVQCAFIDTPEVEAICDHIASQAGFSVPYQLPEYIPDSAGGGEGGGVSIDRDPLFEDAARLVISENVGSTSLIQRRFEIGYPRAGKIMDQLERAGIVGAAQGGKPRKVNMTIYDFEQWLSCTGTTQYQPASSSED
ncbi:MAG: DNA translocase FtsK [Pseudoflavonifractor sp.]|nr:DNA translocase FtsK [Alloprevotella sp.]MCM1117273.1 DNA translocase FtsK [Pseudoflavonifractor sp.]